MGATYCIYFTLTSLLTHGLAPQQVAQELNGIRTHCGKRKEILQHLHIWAGRERRRLHVHLRVDVGVVPVEGRRLTRGPRRLHGKCVLRVLPRGAL